MCVSSFIYHKTIKLIYIYIFKDISESMVSFVVAEETEAEVWPWTPLVHAKILVSNAAYLRPFLQVSHEMKLVCLQG